MKGQMVGCAEGNESGMYVHLKLDVEMNGSLHSHTVSWHVIEGSLQPQRTTWVAQEHCLGTAYQLIYFLFE